MTNALSHDFGASFASVGTLLEPFSVLFRSCLFLSPCRHPQERDSAAILLCICGVLHSRGSAFRHSIISSTFNVSLG